MKLTKNESGYLGYLAAIPYFERIKKENREKYYSNPRLCNSCSSVIPYEKSNRSKFCNHSCAATFINLNRPKKNRTTSKKSRKQLELDMQEKILNGSCRDRTTLKKYLSTHFGSWVCSKCNLTTWNNLPIPLEVDHIDGCAANNKLTNLRLLCPNCHAQTPTAKGKNKGRGRKSLGLRLN